MLDVSQSCVSHATVLDGLARVSTIFVASCGSDCVRLFSLVGCDKSLIFPLRRFSI